MLQQSMENIVMKIFGVLAIIVGLAVGVYVGFWLMFVGGIIDVIEQVRAEPMDALIIAIGIAKIMFSAVVGWLCALVFMLPGWAAVNE